MGKPLKAATIVWALLLGGFVVFLAGSVMLPSTKRARIAPEDLERMEHAVTGNDPASAAAPATQQHEAGPVMSGTKSMVLPQKTFGMDDKPQSTGPVMRSTKSEVLFDRLPLLAPSSNPSTQP